jgi:hypothetical protein
MGESKGTTPAGADPENVMAIGGVLSCSAALRAAEASDQRVGRDMRAVLLSQEHGATRSPCSARQLGSVFLPPPNNGPIHSEMHAQFGWLDR